MEKRINFGYACTQGTYWCFYGVVSSFASVFLLAKGYSNSEIGIILAISNILACILQPLLADLADRSRRVTVVEISQIITIAMMALTVGLFIFLQKSAPLAVIFVLLIVWHTVLQPLLNSMTFKLEECGVAVNFGLARSMGSLAYSVFVMFLGVLVERYGVMVLPVSGEIVLLFMVISLFFVRRQYKKAKKENTLRNKGISIGANGSPSGESDLQAASDSIGAAHTSDLSGNINEESPLQEESINLIQFAKRHKMFLAVNIGVIGLYFSNSVLNSYMIQLVTYVGGSSDDMGRILSYMAILEIPAMVFFNRLRRHFSCETMLKAASIGFVLKVAFCYAANSVAIVFAAQTFQLISFGLFLTAMVHYVDEIMDQREAVKGQALFTTMTTVTTIFSTIIGGIILDISDAKMLMLVATLATAAGAVIIFRALK